MDAITQAYRALGKFASEIEPAKIGSSDFEPTREDGQEIIHDLVCLCEKVDAVIECYGNYLRSHGIVHDYDLSYFKTQLRDALEGNAFFCISSGIDERIEERLEAAE